MNNEQFDPRKVIKIFNEFDEKLKNIIVNHVDVKRLL